MCYNPITIGYSSLGHPIKASCRKCIECRQTRANEWALRCMFELKEHKESCFITLTYRENPIILHKKDMQDFIKRLRKKISPIKIKYFSCGEYGDKFLRPHFHIIIFGYDFKDKKMVNVSKSGVPIFVSNELNKLWTYGLTTVQSVNSQAVRYSALYSTKSHKTGLPSYLWDFPEFNTMSQSMGINGIMKNIDTYLKTDEIYLDGFAYKIPNIVLDKLLKLDFKKYSTIVNRIRENRFIGRPKKDLVLKARLVKKKRLFTKLREL